MKKQKGSDNNAEYEFNDIIFHVNGNHYVCLSKRENKWYLFDDQKNNENGEEVTNITSFKLNELNNKFRYTASNPAYMVLKKKKTVQTIS